ncbi:uncharacterized protein LOC141908293 [Tubulanus polymorphus]|uniref:uncharacterized protein LOC141908293 n=1 Tax=Tubulanus polymorphus TaxID=672921 RepID=UPI003DA650F1
MADGGGQSDSDENKSKNCLNSRSQVSMNPGEDLHRHDSIQTTAETFIYGPLTRKYYNHFEKYSKKKSYLTTDDVRRALNEYHLYPTKSQIYEALHTYGDQPENAVLPFSKFCVLCAALEDGYKKSVPSLVPLSRKRTKSKRHKRKVEGLVNNFQVFLGGACNPTTWRADTAIPYLKKHNITFYNPQVAKWRPELIEIEEQAKSIAQVHFFVIHHFTRCIASLVEAAYLAGSGSQLILVIKPLPDPSVEIMGEVISDTEYSSLTRAQAFIQDLVERRRLPVFDDIQVALQCTSTVIHEGKSVPDLTLADGAQPVKFTHIRVADKYIKIKEAFNAVDVGHKGSIGLDDASLAFKMLTNSELHRTSLPSSKHSHDAQFSLSEFCCLVTEYKYGPQSPIQQFKSFLHSIFHPCKRSRNEEPADNVFSSRDIFLGGSCGDTNWRTEIAIPLLRKHGISYFNPQTPYWSERYIPIEANIKENCYLLLFIITGDTRATAAMLEAGYYIGLGCDVVLCIENVKEHATIEGEELSSQAVKDYNRGRMYLMELANKEAVEVYDDIKDAVASGVQRIIDIRRNPSY